MPKGLPEDVEILYKGIEKCLNQTDGLGRVVGNAKNGIYAFYDYDAEPIYVGQTREQLRVRIRRHLTNQRTDAVAMNVLDPYEVAEIEMWPFWDLENSTDDHHIKNTLNAAEYTVYQKVISESSFGAVLNEKPPAATQLIDLPPSFRYHLLPKDLYEKRKHPDTRVARRATTIANLARVISERDVKLGLRRTLVIQAQRLERLARERYEELAREMGTDK